MFSQPWAHGVLLPYHMWCEHHSSYDHSTRMLRTENVVCGMGVKHSSLSIYLKNIFFPSLLNWLIEINNSFHPLRATKTTHTLRLPFAHTIMLWSIAICSCTGSLCPANGRRRLLWFVNEEMCGRQMMGSCERKQSSQHGITTKNEFVCPIWCAATTTRLMSLRIRSG